jgi:hypothetical protein
MPANVLAASAAPGMVGPRPSFPEATSLRLPLAGLPGHPASAPWKPPARAAATHAGQSSSMVEDRGFLTSVPVSEFFLKGFNHSRSEIFLRSPLIDTQPQ